MIKEIKDILEQVITTHSPVALKKVVRNIKDTRAELSARNFPFVSLLTLQGDFDERYAQDEYKYMDAADSTRKKRTIRGKRKLPVMLKIWAESEESADFILSTIIPYIPRRWELDGLEGDISILQEEHSDHGSNVADNYESVLVVVFAVKVGTVPEIVPTIKYAESEPAL